MGGGVEGSPIPTPMVGQAKSKLAPQPMCLETCCLGHGQEQPGSFPVASLQGFDKKPPNRYTLP